MEAADSIASSSLLSVLSPGVLPSAPAQSDASTAEPGLFAEQLAVLTRAIADPQALAAELQAAGLLDETTSPGGEAQAGSGDVRDLLADLVARLLKEGVKEPEEKPATDVVAAQTTSENDTEPADSPPELEPEAIEPAPIIPPGELTAALLQAIGVFVVNGPQSPATTNPSDETNEPAMPPVGLIETLSPPESTKTFGEFVQIIPPVDVLTDEPAITQTVSVNAAASAPATVQPAVPTATVPATDTFEPPSEKTESEPAADGSVAATPHVSAVAAPAISSVPKSGSQPIAETASAMSLPADRPAPKATQEGATEWPQPASADRPGMNRTASTLAGATESQGPDAEPLRATSTPSLWNTSTAASATVPSTEVVPAQPRMLPPRDATRFVEQLGRYVVEARDEGRQLSVRITPPDLGPLHIEVSTQHGLLTARLETDSTVAHQLLQEHLPQLQETLQQLGAPIERIDIVRTEPVARDREWDQSGGIAGGGDWSASSGQSSPERREEPRRPTPTTRTATNNGPQKPATSNDGTMQGLNIRI